MTFYLRISIDPAEVMQAVPGVVKALEANLPVEDLKTLAGAFATWCSGKWPA